MAGIFQRVGKVRILPTSVKILTIFIIMILLSNFSTNIISMILSQRQIINLTNKILVYQLSDLYTNASNQYMISNYTKDRLSCIKSIKENAAKDLAKKHSITLGVKRDGTFLFSAFADKDDVFHEFSDAEALSLMTESLENNEDSSESQGSVIFTVPDGHEYIGVYKYHSGWKSFLVCAEQRSDINGDIYKVFAMISVIIILLTLTLLFAGISMMQSIFANIKKYTKDIYALQQNQELSKINALSDIKAPVDISLSPNDDITYLVANFNSLYVNTANMKNIFQKFVSKNVVDSAYQRNKVELKGEERELTILFTDIQNFTNRTEVLGNDIISLLNIHYNSIIGIIQKESDDKVNQRSKAFIGSIIGDAVLGVYGIDSSKNSVNHEKSYDAIDSAWKMIKSTKLFRMKMEKRRAELEREGRFDDEAKKVYEAVRLDIGVGIDGGNVFYGNIGSTRYMTNTVIGDNVNSASRIEGLTRLYSLPVLVSSYVKDEVLAIPEYANRYSFYEIDTVQVKGKQEGKKIYFPMDNMQDDRDYKEYYTKEKFETFEEGLAAYYEGDWKSARSHFKKSDLEVARVFLKRMGLKRAPENWSGIWTMTTK